MPGTPHIPLHTLYQCTSPKCGALITHDNTNTRAFNYGRCHCGADLRALPRPRPLKQGVL